MLAGIILEFSKVWPSEFGHPELTISAQLS